VSLSRVCASFSIYLAVVTATLAQSMPTTNVLTRMTVVRSEYGSGTVFSIDVDRREYWITAKHVLTGAKHPPYGSITKKSVSLQLLDPTVREGRWTPVNFSVVDPGKDVDIVVLAADAPLLQGPAQPGISVTFSGVTLGGDCEFLGYPSATNGVWAATWDNGNFLWMPFVKHCLVSSMPDRDTKALFLDGINNPGFSGGPVVYRTG